MLVFTRPLRALALMLIIALTSCQTSRQAPPHPPLALHQRPMREIQALFLDEAAFQNGGGLPSLTEAGELGRDLGTGIASLALGTIWSTTSHAALAVAWPFAAMTGNGSSLRGDVRSLCPESSSVEQGHIQSTAVPGTRLSFHADYLLEARLKDKHQQAFVLAVGHARISITDPHGSYYARADEIQFRPDLQAVLLRGRVSLSAVDAPDLKSFGLLRIDLARCQAFYTGS